MLIPKMSATFSGARPFWAYRSKIWNFSGSTCRLILASAAEQIVFPLRFPDRVEVQAGRIGHLVHWIALAAGGALIRAGRKLGDRHALAKLVGDSPARHVEQPGFE